MTEKDEEIEQLSGKLAIVTTMIPKLMSCRSPCSVYALFLKEQFVNYHMTCVIHGKYFTLNTPQEFFQSFHTAPVANKNFLCELFLHNLVVPNDRDWNPLIYVGVIQLTTLMS